MDMALLDDLQTLETKEAGNWKDIVTAHQDLEAPSSPSGHTSHYGTIPYRFPGAVELTGLGALSDALVCRRRWDAGPVLLDRDVVLGHPIDGDVFINQWRIRAAEEVVRAFQVVKQLEKAAFGKDSFSNLREAAKQRPLPATMTLTKKERNGRRKQSRNQRSQRSQRRQSRSQKRQSRSQS